MTDTRFALGTSTAYLTDQVIALGDGPEVCHDAMTLCATADWNAIIARADELRLDAVVMQEGDQIRVTVAGSASVVVVADDGEHHFDGVGVRVTSVIDGAHHVTLRTGREESGADVGFRSDGGAVPASVVSRRLGAPLDAPDDPFEALFGHTVLRSVEAAAVREAEASIRRAARGVLVFSTGERVVLDADVVVGRNPNSGDPGRSNSCSRDDVPTERARFVKVSDPAVSRRHIAIRIDRQFATVEDLCSANGTMVVTPGSAPLTLCPGAPVDLLIGSSVDLGGAVSFSVEEAA